MSRYLRATLALSSALAGAVLFAAPVAAQPSGDPVSGDTRATAHAGNVVAADCATLFPGSQDISGDLTVTKDDTYLDVTAVADGVEIVGVIVKGGPAYNVYAPADLGDLPWSDLHSPLVPSGKPAAISHWFACGVGASTTTTATTTTTTDTSTSATTTTTTSDSSSPESSGAEVTTTTSADVASAAQDEDLASTGFNGGWLVALAAGLLIAGGAVLVLLRTRARG